jgi:Transglutaminase elicitor
VQCAQTSYARSAARARIRPSAVPGTLESVWRVLGAVALVVLLGGAPAAAAQSDDGHVLASSAAGEAQTQPWSGWWWPAGNSGPTLFAPGGPLDKYDQYVAATSGDNPGTRSWERDELFVPGVAWAGHCNGFAAAALLEPEPTEPVSMLGMTFSVADLKGLLVDYHFGDAAAWSFGADSDLNPADFHRMLLTWLGAGGQGFVLTYDMGQGEVWSYPLYRFESHWTADPKQEGTWDVTTTVWMADMDVPANFVGTKVYPSAAGKTFEYTLQGNPLNPDDGAWTGASRSGRFAHPGRIWYPDPTVRNTERELVSPGLDRQTIANILAGSDGTDLTPTPTPTVQSAPAPVVSPTATVTPAPTSTPTPVSTSTPASTTTPAAAPTSTPRPTLTPKPTPTRARPRP